MREEKWVRNDKLLEDEEDVALIIMTGRQLFSNIKKEYLYYLLYTLLLGILLQYVTRFVERSSDSRTRSFVLEHGSISTQIDPVCELNRKFQGTMITFVTLLQRKRVENKEKRSSKINMNRRWRRRDEL